MRLLSMLASPFNEHDFADGVDATHGGFTAGTETTAFVSPGGERRCRGLRTAR
jgi:hypothetical protein